MSPNNLQLCLMLSKNHSNHSHRLRQLLSIYYECLIRCSMRMGPMRRMGTTRNILMMSATTLFGAYPLCIATTPHMIIYIVVSPFVCLYSSLSPSPLPPPLSPLPLPPPEGDQLAVSLRPSDLDLLQGNGNKKKKKKNAHQILR